MGFICLFNCSLQAALVSELQLNDVCAYIRDGLFYSHSHLVLLLVPIMGSNVFQMMCVLSFVFVRRALSQVLVCLGKKPI